MNPYILIALVVGILVGMMLVKKEKPALIEKQGREKAENLEMVRDYFERMQQATNDDIEQLLGVSDSTATRYLEELEKEGEIRQVGERGKYVHYERVV